MKRNDTYSRGRTRRGWSRFPRANFSAYSRDSIVGGDALLSPCRAAFAKSSSARRDESRSHLRKRSAIARYTIASDRFRQSAMARNCFSIQIRRFIDAFFSRNGRLFRIEDYELSGTRWKLSRILKSLSLSFNVYDAAGSNVPGPTGAAGSNWRIGMTRPDTKERATEPRSLQVFDRVLRG